ncbi:unnamed protein product, partial [Thelazia callipaeda]|uniref:Uncharacterized protein n=1 Tax=Thelazia callipaeda TaxID=103827 RepID=A0A0N5CTF1_THECL
DFGVNKGGCGSGNNAGCKGTERGGHGAYGLGISNGNSNEGSNGNLEDFNNENNDCQMSPEGCPAPYSLTQGTNSIESLNEENSLPPPPPPPPPLPLLETDLSGTHTQQKIAPVVSKLKQHEQHEEIKLMQQPSPLAFSSALMPLGDGQLWKGHQFIRASQPIHPLPLNMFSFFA